LEEEIEKVKKQLYLGRKLRRQNEEEERLRLQEHNNRKLLELPGKDYAFDFSGDLIKIQKSTFKKHLISPTGYISY
jgi:hypothetical protein